MALTSKYRTFDFLSAARVFTRDVHGRLFKESFATATVHATAPPLTHALSTSLTTSLVHFYYCTYCFYYHDYCRYCTQYQSYGQIERNWWRGMYKPPPDPDPSKNLGDLANAGEMVKIG